MPNKKHPRQRNRPRNKVNRLKLLENQNHNENEIQNELNAPKPKENEKILKYVNDNKNVNYDDDMPTLMKESSVGLKQDNKTISISKQQAKEQDPLKNLIQNELNELKPKDEEELLKKVNDSASDRHDEDHDNDDDDDMPGLIKESLDVPLGDNKIAQTVKKHPQEQNESVIQKELKPKEAEISMSNKDNASDNNDDDDDMPGLIEESSANLSHDNKTTQTIKEKPHQQDALENFEKIMKSKFLQKRSKTATLSATEPQSSVAKAKSTGKAKEKVKVFPNIASTNNANEEKNAFIQNLQKKMEAMMANGDETLPNTLMENLQKMFDQGPIKDIETSDDEEEYIEYIYKPRKYFLVALCNLCKMDLCKAAPLIECSKCHMTYYCCIKHMQNDAEHQKLCYALQQVANESCDGHIFKNCSTMAADNFRSYRIVTIRKIESILNRPLTATEQEVVLFPRLCNKLQCREYRFDRLHDCSECGMISYCLEHPEHLSPEEHAKWCKSYQIFKELVQFQEKFGRLEPSLPTKILKEVPLTCLNTKQVFKKLGLDLPENAEYASLTQISTGPLTAWYALKLSDQLRNHESLTIHLIGAEIEFEVDVLHKWELFILHITPSVKNLNIVFVGPELNPHNISFEQLQKTKCCMACRKANRTVKYFFESYIYHDYCGSHKFLTPNLICFFNAGLYRSTGYNMEDTWPDTILAASNLQVPIVVTAYTEYESPMDMTRFSAECQRKLRVIVAPSENPFASVKPERNFISDDEAPLMFKNYYCFVVE